ncbi:unnamed protein product [Acanthoscelides obtectus]|uniref:Actin-binding LIM protein 1 n=1 Tax=Acanthoscelides obtectus TaxID=200917 RepID=A0A9P0PZZ3_ACAOB|nr:unnamed protein product [Acanthoscelides obtectus]CAK1644534.1 Actin-binding LIM protein 1 [Acanthoscelides obtectus]
MGRDGIPYCERDYQKQFGVKCAYCQRFISGKVLQAGDNHHFHPTCARCTKCGDPFGDGEEMYLQGGAIWHPRCGPGPGEDGRTLNGSGPDANGHLTDTDASCRDYDRNSTSGASELQFSMRSRTPSLNGSLYSPTSMSRKHYSYRTPSPGLILREHNKSATLVDDISRIYTYSYLTEEPTLGYLRRPIDPYDKAPTSPHFHRPTSQNSLRGSACGAGCGRRSASRSAMRALVDSIRSETPRPRSPHMNNEEPIELAHFPAAKPPQPGEPLKIERDDFPAPPYPYTDPERRKRWSDSYKGVADSDEDEADATSKAVDGDKLKKEEEELSKIASGIGKVFLKNVQEREKIKQWKAAHLDPRNASRTPSANKEPTYRLRYDNPIGASPSRNLDHPKPFDDDDFDRSLSCRSSVGRSIGAIPNYNVVSSLRMVPRPGYGLKSSTLPARNGYGDYSFSGMGAKTHSTDFSCGKSDISTGSITDVERRALNSEMPVSTTYTGGLGRYPGAGGISVGYASQVRRSLPNMAHSMLINEPAKIYPYHLLQIINYRLPADVDRINLERHLSDQEFEALFQMSRTDFYRLPMWRRNELKRRLRLF